MRKFSRQQWIAVSLIGAGIVLGSVVGSSLLRARAQNPPAGNLPPPSPDPALPLENVPPASPSNGAPPATPPAAQPSTVPAPPAAGAPAAPPAPEAQTLPAPPEDLPPLPTDAFSSGVPGSGDTAAKTMGIDGFIYQPEGLRDPFFPIRKSIPKEEAQNIEVKPHEQVYDAKDPLQSFEIREYRLVGVLWNVKDPKAMVSTPDGKIWTIRQKNRLGREGCIVAAIRESEIVVAEPNADGSYVNATTRIISMKK